MATNVIKTRMQSKYDTLQNWIASATAAVPFIPLKGEICIVEIPNFATPADTTTTNQAQMTPPAIGIKVGDGTHVFTELPWIQGIAGDVYGWAKSSVKPAYTGTEILTIKKDSLDLTDETKWTTSTVEAWLQDLTDELNSLNEGTGSITEQISSALNALDVSNISGFSPSKTLATLTETNGLIAATFQNIEINESQVTNLNSDLSAKAPLASPALTGTPTAPTAETGTETTQIATTAFVANTIENALSNLTNVMHFTGDSLQLLPDNSTSFSTYETGDVILVGTKEYVYSKKSTAQESSWILLGDESSYAIKGSISKLDLNNDLQTLIDNKIDSTVLSSYVEKETGNRLITAAEIDKLSGISSGAEVNIISAISVNGTNLTITNKNVDIAIPITTIKTRENNTDTTITPTVNHELIFNPIAFDGDANHLIQNSGDYLILDCGNSTTTI